MLGSAQQVSVPPIMNIHSTLLTIYSSRHESNCVDEHMDGYFYSWFRWHHSLLILLQSSYDLGVLSVAEAKEICVVVCGSVGHCVTSNFGDIARYQ